MLILFFLFANGQELELRPDDQPRNLRKFLINNDSEEQTASVFEQQTNPFKQPTNTFEQPKQAFQKGVPFSVLDRTNRKTGTPPTDMNMKPAAERQSLTHWTVLQNARIMKLKIQLANLVKKQTAMESRVSGELQKFRELKSTQAVLDKEASFYKLLTEQRQLSYKVSATHLQLIVHMYQYTDKLDPGKYPSPAEKYDIATYLDKLAFKLLTHIMDFRALQVKRVVLRSQMQSLINNRVKLRGSTVEKQNENIDKVSKLQLTEQGVFLEQKELLKKFNNLQLKREKFWKEFRKGYENVGIQNNRKKP